MSAHTPGPSATADACGCRVVRLAGVEQFIRCPTHAAAPEMLEALRVLVNRANDARADGTTHLRVSTGDDAWMGEARALLGRIGGR